MSLVAQLTKPRSKRSPLHVATEDAWGAASEALDIDLFWTDTAEGPFVAGWVGDYEVTVAAMGEKHRVRTAYTVKFDAPEAPSFVMAKSFTNACPRLDTRNAEFDAIVAGKTSDPGQLRSFLTPGRREAVLELMADWPLAQIKSNEITITTNGLESDAATIVDSVVRIVGVADLFEWTSVADFHLNPGQGVVDAPSQLALDEVSVLSDLFDSGLDIAATAARFEDTYKGQEVTWFGEILTVGAHERSGQRIAALVGSADGQTTTSGRVVALTVVPPSTRPVVGDVVSFTGSLRHLEARRRLFRIE